MESHNINLALECKKLTERHKVGRVLEQLVVKALVHLKLDLQHNDFSDEGYPLSQSPVDHWNDRLVIEDKNPSGNYMWTLNWVIENIGNRMPDTNKKKILVTSTYDAYTKPAINYLLRQRWFMVQVGYQVTDPNDSNALYQLIIQLDPIVTLVAVEPCKGPLIPITDVYDDNFDLEYLLKQDEVFDELYLESLLSSDFYIPHDESMPHQPEVFDYYPYQDYSVVKL
jgi:hypothetical protein